MANSARIPRSIVKLNGVPCTWVEWDIDNNNFYSADTFRVVVLPDNKVSGFDLSNQTTIEVEILAGFPGNPAIYTEDELTSLIIGRADEVEYDPVQRMFTLHGRDLTSLLIDTKTTVKHQNHTASQIVQELAQAHSLTAQVTTTQRQAGSYYQIDHARLSSERSEWDILTYLAQEEGFDVFVKGRTLYFQPKPDNPVIVPIVFGQPTINNGSPIFNGSGIRFSRNLSVAKGVTVTVVSWNSKTNKTITAYFPKSAKTITPGNARTPGGTQNYVYNIPELTKEKADALAAKMHRDRSQHEMKLFYDGPADITLDVQQRLDVTGTGTVFDQSYFPDMIQRSMSSGGGFEMRVSAKNHNPNSEINL